MGRRIIIFSLVFLALAVAFSVYVLPNATVAYRSLYIVSHVVPAVPEWFEWGRYEVEEREDPVGDSEVVDIYFPQGKEQASFIIFFPGFNPDGARDPRMVKLARSFAGAGVGVAVPDSKNIKQRVFSRGDVDLIKQTFYFLQDQSYVNSDRIALSGFSIAGSYSLRAASELDEEPLFVHSLGAYYDLEELVNEVISEKVFYKGTERPWEPDSLSKELAGKVDADALKELSDDISPSETLPASF